MLQAAPGNEVSQSSWEFNIRSSVEVMYDNLATGRISYVGLRFLGGEGNGSDIRPDVGQVGLVNEGVPIVDVMVDV